MFRAQSWVREVFMQGIIPRKIYMLFFKRFVSALYSEHPRQKLVAVTGRGVIHYSQHLGWDIPPPHIHTCRPAHFSWPHLHMAFCLRHVPPQVRTTDRDNGYIIGPKTPAFTLWLVSCPFTNNHLKKSSGKVWILHQERLIKFGEEVCSLFLVCLIITQAEGNRISWVRVDHCQLPQTEPLTHPLEEARGKGMLLIKGKGFYNLNSNCYYQWNCCFTLYPRLSMGTAWYFLMYGHYPVHNPPLLVSSFAEYTKAHPRARSLGQEVSIKHQEHIVVLYYWHSQIPPVFQIHNSLTQQLLLLTVLFQHSCVTYYWIILFPALCHKHIQGKRGWNKEQ